MATKGCVDVIEFTCEIGFPALNRVVHLDIRISDCLNVYVSPLKKALKQGICQ